MSILLARAPAKGASEAGDEYKIKAAFIYNFLKFVEWSDSRKQDPNTPLVIGILGEDPFANAFAKLKGKTINGRDLQIRRYTGMATLMSSGDIDRVSDHPQMDAIKVSHLLFISVSEKKHVKAILNTLDESGILTVGDTKGYLELGVVINLFMDEDRTVRFDVNTGAAKRAELKLRAKLLRLAKRLI